MVDLSNATWRKSRPSVDNGCVEVVLIDTQVVIRNSKDRFSAVLVFTVNEWESFIGAVRKGEFRVHSMT